MSDLNVWLAKHQLSVLGPVLCQHDIDLDTLGLLSDEDLKDIGVSLGHRRRLLAALSGSVSAEADTTIDDVARIPIERRNVVVLFVDLADFTALSEELDPEDLTTLIDGFMVLVREKVTAFGGAVDKQVGDGALALFGAPRAYGDDALRAARAALGIFDDLDQLSQQFGRPLAAHAGLSIGEIVAGGEHGVVGHAVNASARLDALAKTGEILIDHALRVELGAAVRATDLGEHALKGMAEPVTVWRLEGLAPASQSPPETLFVGRGTELSQILAAAETLLHEEAGAIFVLRGDPGIGKTRLLEEVLHRLNDSGFTAHKAHFLNFGAGRTRDAMCTLMQGLAGINDDRPPSDQAEGAATFIAKSGREPRVRIALSELLDTPLGDDLTDIDAALDADAREESRRDAVHLLLDDACAQKPRLIAIEDIHWAPQSALTLIEHLARAATTRRLMLVLTTRPEGNPFAHSNQPFQGLSATGIDLGPLRLKDAERLARTRLSDAPDLVASCVRKADGNPLFLEQLVRTAVAGSHDLPGTLQHMVLARVDALDAKDRAAIRAASIFGQRLTLADLRALLGDGDFHGTPIFERGLFKIEGQDIVFGHALLQEGVYRSILKSERRTLHAAAARLFEGRDPVLHAHHLKEARSPQAAAAHLVAAQDALARHRPQVALTLAQEGATLANDDETGLGLSILEAQTLLDMGNALGAVPAWERVLARVTTPAERGKGLLGMAGALRLAGSFDAALATAEQATAALEGDGSLEDRSLASHLVGNLQFARGEGKKCEASHGRALVLARKAGSAEAEVAALGGLADAAIAQGHMTSAHGALLRCIDAAEATGLHRTAAGYRSIAPLTSYFALDFPGADRFAQEAFKAAQSIGHTRAEYLAHHSIEYVLFQRGDLESCRANIMRSSELLERLGNRAFQAYLAEKRAGLYILEGDELAAREALEEATAIARATSFRLAGSRLLAHQAKLAPDAASARSLAQQALAAQERGALGLNALQAYAFCADAALKVGDATWAQNLSRTIRALGEEDGIPWALYLARRTDALASFLSHGADGGLIDELEQLYQHTQDVGWAVEAALLKSALSAARLSRPWAISPTHELLACATS